MLTLTMSACREDVKGRSTSERVAVNETLKIALNDLKSIELIEQARIDGYEANLVPIRPTGGVVVTRDGGVAVAQPQDNRIVFFDGEGRWVGAFGRAGAGPGEFRGIFALGLIDDSIWAWDPVLRRATVISPGLEYVRTITPQALPTIIAGHTVVASFILGINNNGTLVGLAFSNGALLFRTAIGSNDNVILARVTSTDDDHSVTLPDGGSTDGNVFRIYAHFDVSSDGRRIAVARPFINGVANALASVVLMSVDGDTIFYIKLQLPQRKLPRHVADSAIEVRALKMPAANAAAFRKGAFIPPIYPPVSEIVIGQDGRIWVQLGSDAEGQSYLVLNEDGSVVGVARLPTNARVAAAAGRSVWAIERDDRDVESLRKYAMPAH